MTPAPGPRSSLARQIREFETPAAPRAPLSSIGLFEDAARRRSLTSSPYSEVA